MLNTTSTLSTKEIQTELKDKPLHLIYRTAAIKILPKCCWESGATGSLKYCWGGCRM